MQSGPTHILWKIFQCFTEEFYQKQYGEPNGRRRPSVLKSSDDYAWRIVCGDMLIIKFIELDCDADKFMSLKEDVQ